MCLSMSNNLHMLSYRLENKFFSIYIQIDSIFEPLVDPKVFTVPQSKQFESFYSSKQYLFLFYFYGLPLYHLSEFSSVYGFCVGRGILRGVLT